MAFDVVFANEYDKVFAALHDEGMYSWARRHKKKFCPITSTESISDLPSDFILKTAFPKGAPNMWGLIGGPPCQAYSLAGRIRDPNGMRDDYRNYLFESYIRILEHFKPSFFVFEKRGVMCY